MLHPGGLLLLTLPNGYGWFEMDSTVYRLFELLGITQIMRRVKKSGMRRHGKPKADTLALSLHLNFFSYSQIRQTLAGFGFQIQNAEGRSFVCGDITTRLLAPFAGPALYQLNNWLGSRLPKQLVSGWMFAATTGNPPDTVRINQLAGQRPNWYARLKRKLNMAATRRLERAAGA